MNIVGQAVNGYLFEEALGSGSFGDVYRVSKGNETYAAKVLSDVYILEEFKKEQNRITREIDVLKSVKGKNLIRYQEDFFFKNEFGIKQYVIVMEYFKGKTLKKILQNQLSLEQKLCIFRSILQGVKDLHHTVVESHGIIHRDLKPDNILVDDKLQVKIIDYGLSRIIDFSSITSTGARLGSPLYMSPEQIKDSRRIDYRSDIYALGIILYEMLTKHLPYQAVTLPELMMKILHEPILPPRRFCPDLSEELEKIILKAAAKEPFARFQTIDEFIDALDQKNISKEIDAEGKFYAWIYREREVAKQFEKENETNIIYPVHVQNWMKRLHLYFASRKFKNVILDPSTQRLSYHTFQNTKGLVALPYAPKEGVISLEYLKDCGKRKEYIDAWYAFVSMGQKLILPYHYISNTDYSVDQVDDWIRMNMRLVEESCKIVEKGKEKYAMVSIGLGHLVFQAEKILSYFVHANVDGYVVQVSDMKQLNEQSMGCYLDFMENLQKYTGKPVIALKVPIPLGLALLAKGISGFSLGLSGIEYFDEQYIKEERDSYQLSYSKFYFPQTLSLLMYPKTEEDAFERLYEYFGGCKCRWCKEKSASEIGTLSQSSRLHHWQMMMEEADAIHRCKKEDRLPYLKSRLEDALKNLDSIPEEILESQKHSDAYRLLKNLNKIL